MAIEVLNLSSLSSIDQGRLAVAFEHELKKCEADCSDRPAIEKARIVRLEISLTPRLAEGSLEMESADVFFKVSSAIPKKETRNYNMRATRSGLVFNELSPDNVNQATLDMAPKPKKVGG